jgi:hypothetical protein
MGFVGSLVGGILGSGAADDAAKAQAKAAKEAQDLIAKQQQDALDFQRNEWSGQQALEKPYQSLGFGAANSLANLLQGGFHAPTLEEAQQNPGYQFALQTGTNALEKGAAARGNLLSGSEGTALQQYGQGLGEQNYQQVYNRALENYMTNYQTLMGGAGLGSASVGRAGQLGQAAAQNIGGIDLTGADMQARQINNAAAARASGYLGSANAWSKAAGGMAGGIMGGLGNMDFSGGSSPWEMAGQFAGF